MRGPAQRPRVEIPRPCNQNSTAGYKLMNRFYCEREGAIIQALRGGALGGELEKHVATCAICADTLAASEFLQADTRASQVDASAVQVDPRPAPVLPDSDFLWWKAQLARKEMAVQRATRSIALVRRISYLGVAAAGLWLVFAPGHLASIPSTLRAHEIWPTSPFSQTAGALTQTALFLGAGALVSALLGSLYLVRQEK